MSLTGCQHLQSFKKSSKNRSTFKWVHAVFVVNSSANSLKAKLGNCVCRVCKKRGPRLHACLECVFFGCLRHIRDHSKTQKHCMSIDLTYGQTHCDQCHDYIYDSDLDALALDNKMKAKRLRKRLFEIDPYTSSNRDDQDFLKSRTKPICITPKSTIGLRGLLNLGATCFMNCIVQALMHTPLLRDYFLTERHWCNRLPRSCLVCEVSKLFREFYNGTRVPLALHELLHLIWTHAKHLAGYEQQDAHEFFIATLDVLHRHFSEMPNSKSLPLGKITECPCIIDQIFTGRLQSDIVCQKCKGVSTTVDPISDFSLDLGPVTFDGRPPSTLVDCLERFTRSEHIGNEIKCSSCQSKQESTKQLTMKMLPIVVSFHLKRFEHMKKKEKKISTLISFPEMLDMTPFMSGCNDMSPFPPDNRYSLFAVINHRGNSINAGHYTAYVRQLQDYWYKCDDHLITRATLEEVLDSEGYLLFYHKHLLEYE